MPKTGISSYARKYLRIKTTDNMVDRCKIYKPGPPGYDKTTGRSTNTVGQLKYEGPCRLWEVPGGQQIVVGEEEITITQTHFSIPYWVMPLPEQDDIVVMMNSEDPDLVGRTLNIKSTVRGGGLRPSRQFQVQVAESKKEHVVMAEDFVNYTQITALSDRLKFAQKHAPKIVDKWMHSMVGPALVKEMQAVAPVDTGALRNAIRQIDFPGGVRVGPLGIKYNVFVVEGTKPHTITAKGSAMVFKVGGKTIFAKSVKHPGTKANPYMDTAAKAVMAKWVPKLMELSIDLKRIKDV